MLPIVHHPEYQVPLRPNHRFPMSKYGYLRETLIAGGLLKRGRYLAPKLASLTEVATAHTLGYAEAVFNLTLGKSEVRRIGLPQNELVVRRARLSAAGTTLAAWLAIETGIACNSAGGSHHAGPDYGAGFCVLNDVAVAIGGLRAQGVAGRILIVDADVHQGDGTARIFAGDDSVFTLSVHAEKNYPVNKAVSDIDVGLPDSTSDAEYLTALGAAIEEALAAADPVLVFYNAGVDVHGEDRLGRLALSDTGIRARESFVLSKVRARGVPIVGVIGGGYSPDPQDLARRHAILFEEAARLAV